MKFLCLIYIDEGMFDGMPDDEWNRHADEALEGDNRLRESGHYVSSEALDSVRTAATLRVRNGKLSVTDGPFAETKEQLGGFILIEASDFDEAIKVASNIPMVRYASIEVRPILPLGEKRLGAAGEYPTSLEK